jgi:hypothetical protein
LERVALITSAAALDVGEDFDIAASRSADATRWRIRLVGSDEASATIGPTVLADLWIDDDGLQFQWQATAADSPVAAQLQNCLLTLHAAGEEAVVALRGPADRPALVLDLSTPANLTDISLDAPPRAAALVLEIGSLDSLPRPATFADERRRAAFASPIPESVVVLLDMLDDEHRPQIAVEPVASRKGLQVRITPSIANADGGFSLSRSRVAEIKRTFGARKIRTDKVWKESQQQIAMLRKQIENIDKQLLSFPQQQAALQRQRGLAAAQLNEAQATFDKADADKAEIDTLLETMPPVEDLIGELHKKAKLPFRIVAKIESSPGSVVEIEIARSIE